MRCFVRQAVYGGCVCAFNQYYKLKSRDNILKNISKKLNVKGNVYDIVEAYMIYKNKLFKLFGKEYESYFDDYRDENVEEKNYMNKKVGELANHKLLQRLSLSDLLWIYDATSLYPSVMWDEMSLYPEIETGYAFTKDMNDELVENFNIGNFTRGSAI